MENFLEQTVNFKKKGYAKLSLPRREPRCKQMEIDQQISCGVGLDYVLQNC
jgi:hypothetical protein